METDAPICQHLFHTIAQDWPGNRHGLWLGGKQVYFAFAAQAAFAQNVCDEHSAFVRRAGYLAAADAGNVVVLFPQVEPSFQPLNPNGCWDWWGYEGEDYATRNGVQLRAVRAMIGDLLDEAP